MRHRGEVTSQVMMGMVDCLWGSGSKELSGALTLAMGEEVVSERGGGAGVTISGAHTVTAQGRAELLHACQSLCREGGCGTGEIYPRPSSRGEQCGEEIEGHLSSSEYTDVSYLVIRQGGTLPPGSVELEGTQSPDAKLLILGRKTKKDAFITEPIATTGDDNYVRHNEAAMMTSSNANGETSGDGTDEAGRVVGLAQGSDHFPLNKIPTAIAAVRHLFDSSSQGSLKCPLPILVDTTQEDIIVVGVEVGQLLHVLFGNEVQDLSHMSILNDGHALDRALAFHPDAVDTVAAAGAAQLAQAVEIGQSGHGALLPSTVPQKRIALQCNRYSVQDVLTLLKKRAGRRRKSGQGKTGKGLKRANQIHVPQGAVKQWALSSPSISTSNHGGQMQWAKLNQSFSPAQPIAERSAREHSHLDRSADGNKQSPPALFAGSVYETSNLDRGGSNRKKKIEEFSRSSREKLVQSKNKMFSKFTSILQHAVEALAPSLPLQEDFVYHWKAITHYYIETSDDKAPVTDTNIPSHLEQMLDILTQEEGERESGETGPCMEYLLHHKILETLYTLGRLITSQRDLRRRVLKEQRG
ncbi:hypothetical protein INR49_009801 [Caranx melampygus]|nr:hypothetical protein INR49_009801 [Caranx melampygus]